MYNLYRFVRVIFCSNFPDCQVTTCLSSHMTLFGGGFFVQPHSLDFKFIFAESDFSVGDIDMVLCVEISYKVIYRTTFSSMSQLFCPLLDTYCFWYGGRLKILGRYWVIVLATWDVTRKPLYQRSEGDGE